MKRLVLSAAALALGVLGACAGAQPTFAAEKRVALVIGNSAYQHAPALPNPVRDAKAMVAMFEKGGFSVITADYDAGNLHFKRVIRQFEDAAADADIAVIYYAGHGIEIHGVNYLIPVDAKLASDRDAEDEAITLDRLVEAADSAKRLRLVILDACRDNPFVRTMKRQRTAALRGVSAGLSKVEPTGMNTLIAFASKGGAAAEDGDADHSPFTAALLDNLFVPGLDVRLAFGRARDEVLKKTSNRQEPYVYGSLGGASISIVPAPEQDAPPVSAITEGEKGDYALVEKIGTKGAWEVFLAQHPKGFYADLARQQITKLAMAETGAATVMRGPPQQQMAAVEPPKPTRPPGPTSEEQREWDKIKNSSNADLFREFIRRYPTSPLANTAQSHLETIEAAARERERLAREREEKARQEAEKARQEAERQAEAKRQAEQAAALKRAQEEAKAAEEARQKAEREAARKHEEEERQRKLAEEARAKQEADAKAARERAEREAARKREEEERRRKLAEEARAKAAADAEAARLRAEQAAALKRAQEEARAAEEARQKAEREAARKREEEERQRKLAEESRAKQEADAKAAQAKAEREAAARLRAEQEAALKRAGEETKAAEAARQKAEREAARKREEEERQRKLAEEARAKQEAEAKAAQERAEQEAARKREEEERQRKIAEESRAKAAADAEAARLRAEQEAALKRAREEAKAAEAARQKAERDAALKREEEERQRKLAEADQAKQDACRREEDRFSALQGLGAKALDDLKQFQQQLTCARLRPLVVAALKDATAEQDVARGERVRAAQQELARVGCFGGVIDGSFGDSTRTALERYLAQQQRPSRQPEITEALLSELKSQPARVCPLACPARQVAEGDECIAEKKSPPIAREKSDEEEPSGRRHTKRHEERSRPEREHAERERPAPRRESRENRRSESRAAARPQPRVRQEASRHYGGGGGGGGGGGHGTTIGVGF